MKVTVNLNEMKALDPIQHHSLSAIHQWTGLIEKFKSFRTFKEKCKVCKLKYSAINNRYHIWLNFNMFFSDEDPGCIPSIQTLAQRLGEMSSEGVE